MNKTIQTLILVGLLVIIRGVSADTKQQFSYHHCVYSGGSGNSPHLFDMSEVYTCDEGVVEIAGQQRQVIENGWVYSTELGRPIGVAHVASDHDYKSYQWCPIQNGQQERCGDKPIKCWDGRMGTWNSNWQGYSCVTPDHHK